MGSSKFIVIEGVGGAGKSTVSKKVFQKLQDEKIDAILTREPGGLPEAESIRELIFDLKRDNLIGAENQAVLFSAARKLWMQQIVKPALAKGLVVIADRSYISTNAYQGVAEGGDSAKILKITEIAMENRLPDLVVYLDIDASTAIKRNVKSKGNDPFDDQGLIYTEKLVRAYRAMEKENWSGVKWEKVDANKPLKDVVIDVYKIIVSRI